MQRSSARAATPAPLPASAAAPAENDRRYHSSSLGRTCRPTPDSGASGENGTRMRPSNADGIAAARHAASASSLDARGTMA